MTQPPRQKRHTSVPVVVVGVIFLIVAVVAGLIGAIVLVARSSLDSMPLGVPIVDPSTGRAFESGAAADLVGGILVGFAIMALALAAAHLAAGIGVIRRSGWARILGMALSGIGLLLGGLLLLASLAALGEPPAGTRDAPGGFVVAAVLLGAYLFSLIVLARRGDVFRRV